ncbi:MAG: Rrf2 family transcriptional regulator [Bacteroidetes bacterium HGW-Bacteroidetes-5]|jgi:Rrf2 family protein|nr:MAG: Rrf2 family transcriptional regulator [Bacteroidetes bacterium HGW-Bacteroidetes-5]
MKINTKIRYGMRAMIDIANSQNPEGVLQKDIALHQDISLKYLDSIIAALKLKGLIANSKGKGSGYKLTRDPNEITVWDIYTAFEPTIIVDCIENKEFCNRSCDCKSRDYWIEFKKDLIELLSKKRLSQIIFDNNHTN